MTQEIQVYIRNVYGNDLVYPVCEKAKAFAAISRQATLNNSIGLIKRIGFEVKVVADPSTKGLV